MKISLVHNFYSSREPSGENEMVKQQMEALREDGHAVKLFSFNNDDSILNKLDKFKAAFITSTGFGKSPKRGIQLYKPDVVLVNNLFPNVGNRWLKSMNIPIITFVHNYRSFCATGLNFRNNRQCFDCTEKSPLEGLKHACYRNSSLATLPLTIAQFRREHFFNEQEYFDHFIALSEGSKEILTKSGLPAYKTTVIPNFVEDFMINRSANQTERNGKWISVGRLSTDKGFVNLIDQWPAHHQLDIVGDGPAMAELIARTRSRSNIRLLGRMEREKILKILPSYLGAVHPSLWPEVCPLTVIEFLCAGLPVVTLSSNTSAKTLVDWNSGLVLNTFTPTNLEKAFIAIKNGFDEYSRNARICYLENFTKSNWITEINQLLAEIIISKQAK